MIPSRRSLLTGAFGAAAAMTSVVAANAGPRKSADNHYAGPDALLPENGDDDTARLQAEIDPTETKSRRGRQKKTGRPER